MVLWFEVPTFIFISVVGWYMMPRSRFRFGPPLHALNSLYHIFGFLPLVHEMWSIALVYSICWRASCRVVDAAVTAIVGSERNPNFRRKLHGSGRCCMHVAFDYSSFTITTGGTALDRLIDYMYTCSPPWIIAKTGVTLWSICVTKISKSSTTVKARDLEHNNCIGLHVHVVDYGVHVAQVRAARIMHRISTAIDLIEVDRAWVLVIVWSRDG